MKKKILVVLLLALAIGAGGALEYTFQIGEGLRAHQPAKGPTQPAMAAAQSDARAETSSLSLPAKTIRPGFVNRLGVRTATVERRTLQRRVEAVGYVEYDRTKLRHVYAQYEGTITNLTVRSEGERVQKEQFLFDLDSPTLSQWFGKVFAEQGGIITDLPVIEGTWARPTDIVMTIVDLSSVWVLTDVFEDQADWVRVGQKAEVRLPSIADRVWQGKVEYIYPNLDPETRTLKARLRFDNPDEVLKPNMLAEVKIHGEPRRDVLAVPREVLIETGKHQRVILALGEGRFEPRTVTAGMESQGWVEMIDGLQQGERVVVSGQFLIDSESSLQASLVRLKTEIPKLTTMLGGCIGRETVNGISVGLFVLQASNPERLKPGASGPTHIFNVAFVDENDARIVEDASGTVVIAGAGFQQRVDLRPNASHYQVRTRLEQTGDYHLHVEFAAAGRAGSTQPFVFTYNRKTSAQTCHPSQKSLRPGGRI